MATRTLDVVISGDSRGMAKATKEADRSLDRLGKSGSKTLAHLKAGMLAVGAAAGVGLVVGLKKSAEAAIESEKANARLQAQLAALDISYDKHEKQIQRVIDSHSQLSGFDDEDLGDSFTNIVRVTGDVNEALRLNVIAMDFARAKGLDVAKSGELIGKVAGGNTGILSRYGIVLKEGATTQEALATLQQRFAGQAEAYGRTTAGASDRAKVALENLGEEIGARMTPLIARAAEGFNNLVRQFTLGRGPGGRIRTVLENVGETAVDVARQIADLVGWFRRHRTTTDVLISVVAGLTAAFVAYKVATIAAAVATKVLTVATIALNVAMRANPIGIIVTALIALGAGLVVAYKRSETFRRIVDGAFATVKKSATSAANAIKAVVVPAFNAIRDVAREVAKAVGWVGRAFGNAKDAVGGAADWANPFGDGIGMGGALPSGGAFGGSLMGADSDLRPFAAMGSRFGLGVVSGLRPGAITNSGNPSYHGTGDAIDVAGSPSGMLAFFRQMRSRFGGRLAELIYTPGGVGISDGRPYRYTGVTAADHFDHVHLAYTGSTRADPRGARTGDGIGQAVRAARSVGFSGDRLATMVAIAGAESGYDANINAAGPEDSRGFWQINVGPGANTDLLSLGNLYDPMVNAKAMKIILGRQGLNAWSVYSSGKYRDWLGRARAAISGTGSAGGGGTGGTATPFKPGSGSVRGSGNTAAGLGSTEAGGGSEALTGPGGGGMEQRLAAVGVRRARAERKDNLGALIKALVAERKLKRRRRAKVMKALRGRLGKATRLKLTEELGELESGIGDLNALIAEYKADKAGGAETITEAEELDAGVAAEGEEGPSAMDYAEAAMAQAGLTPGLDDDLAAAIGIADQAYRDYQAALATGDPRQIATAANNLRNSWQQVEDLRKAITENTEAQERIAAERVELDRQLIENQRLILKLADQGDRIVAAVVAAANGGIGGTVGLGLQTPGFAGANYHTIGRT